MAKVTYAPAQGEPEETTQFGYHFAKGKSVDVTDEKHLAKFRGNPYFAVAEKKGNDKKEELKAEHHGGGRFRITHGEEVLSAGLSKAEADAFNAMSDEDKQAYIEAGKQ